MHATNLSWAFLKKLSRGIISALVHFICCLFIFETFALNLVNMGVKISVRDIDK